MRKFILRGMNEQLSLSQSLTLLDLTPKMKEVKLPIACEPAPETPMLLAKMSCGLFGISEDMIEKYQSLDALFIKNRFNTFFFEAAGDSMEPTIYSGQILIVDRSKKDFHGKVCAVAYEDKIICKRVFIKENSIILKSDNPKYRDIHVQQNESVNLWGVVIAIAGYIE